jgi:hypothetical protein
MKSKVESEWGRDFDVWQSSTHTLITSSDGSICHVVYIAPFSCGCQLVFHLRTQNTDNATYLYHQHRPVIILDFLARTTLFTRTDEL